jgi:hypothetical protein
MEGIAFYSLIHDIQPPVNRHIQELQSGSRPGRICATRHGDLVKALPNFSVLEWLNKDLRLAALVGGVGQPPAIR